MDVVEPRFMNRNDKVLCSIDRSMRILELGPLTNPIAPKSDGWATTVVDHGSREQLVEKYGDDSAVDTSRIVDVDFVWSHGPLEAAVPRELHGTFDAFIASHVFEHIPDPIGLLRSLEQVLRPTSVVSLVIPDKRFCFDFFRPLSTVGGLLDAHARRAVRHSRKALFDHVACLIRADGETAFSRRRLHDIDFAHSLGQAKAHFDTLGVGEDAPYVDAHGWVFTPSSFALAMLELSALNAIDFTVVRSFPSEGCEFYVTLRRGRVDHRDTDVLQARRLKLQRRTLEELREQAEMLDERKAAPTAEVTDSRVDAALEPPSSACDQVRLAHVVEPRFMNRNDKVLCSIDRSMRILELGPLTNPIAPKSDGWVTTVVDHGSREQLVEKYRDDSAVDTSRIVDVDFVWSHGPLEAAVPRELHGTFDAFIASHVFEHIPDPIGLLRSLEQVLRPTSVVSLVIPDKRFCFDFFRPLSTVGGLLDAHARRAVRHSRKALFDHVAYSIRADGEPSFSRRRLHDIDFAHSLGQAKAHFDAPSVEEDGPYHDVHGWMYTPSSFALAMLELSALNAIDFTMVRSFPSEGCEFYVTLRRGRVNHEDTDVLQARRLKLQRRTMEELREQAEMLHEPNLNELDRADLCSGDDAALEPPSSACGEVRLAHVEEPRLMNRNDKVLCSIDRSMRILELGPLTNPIAPKSDGWLTTVVDHASREQLVEKYRDDSAVDTSRIVDVDFVWSHGPLEAAVPRELHGSFDAFIASHVFEHIPDPIGLLRSLEQVLRPNGVVSLVIPDKRFCFDFFRPLSTVGELLDAHARKADRHARKALFDQVAYSIRADGEPSFSRRQLRDK